jgi:hypothetical protein
VGPSSSIFEGFHSLALSVRWNWDCVQRLFSTFADGWPGGGLLLQRVVIGGTLVHREVACLTANTVCGAVVADSVGGIAGVLLIAGLWTPVTGAVIAILEASSQQRWR